MHKGRVKKIIRDKGFGFISDNDGREIFFHQHSLIGMAFEALHQDQRVEFEVEDAPRGPRAVNIKAAVQQQ